MKKPHVLLTGLQITAGALYMLTLLAQPSFSLESSPSTLRGNPKQATVNLREAEAHNNRGVELAEQGKVPEAIAAFNQALKIDPTYENAYNNLGLALGSQDKFSEAAAAFNQALGINPRNVETYNNLGIALGSQGKFSEAVVTFGRAIQINPQEPTSHQNLGVAFWSQGKLSEAAVSLQKARELYSAQKNTEGVHQVEQILQQLKSP